MRNRCVVILVLACAATAWLGAVPVSAAFVAPTDLSPGQQYQLVFFTESTRNAMSSNIDDYNGFVTAEAAIHPDLPATSWHAIVSICQYYNGIWARDNAPTYEGVPVYNTRGERVSDGTPVTAGAAVRTDFYDTQNDLHHHAIYDPEGDPLGVAYVATGSYWTGSAKYAAGAPPYYYYGWPFRDNPITVGLPDRLNDGWIDCGMDAGNYAVWTDFHFYALSSVLTFQGSPGGAVAEPATLVIWSLLAVCGVTIGKWRKRKPA